MGDQPFEDVSPIKNGSFPACYVSLPERFVQIFLSQTLNVWYIYLHLVHVYG